MLKSYEAVYNHGRLHWIHQAPPELAKETRVIVVLDIPQHQEENAQESIHALLQRTRGSLGRGKTLQEIDQEIQVMR
jgi:hypothetical protein